MTDCYVYYRVAAGREDAARRALAALQADLRTRTDIAGRTYAKAGEPLLWMEVYTGVADAGALTDLLDELAGRHGLLACLAENGRRHVEQFLPLPLTPP